MRVVGKKILVKQSLTDLISKGGIHVAGDAEPLPYGKVIQIGAVCLEEEASLKVGDTVLFSAIGAIPLGIKKNHVLIEWEDVLAILDEEDIKNAGS